MKKFEYRYGKICHFSRTIIIWWEILDMARTDRNICNFGPKIWASLQFLKRNILKNIMEATFGIFIGQEIVFKFFCTLWHTWIRYPNGTYFGKYVPFGYLIHVCHNVQKILKIISWPTKISNVAFIMFCKHFSWGNAV